MFDILKMIVIGIIAFMVIICLSLYTEGDCSKDLIIDTYDKIIRFFGEEILTSDKKLEGEREYGIDKYVGTYESNYKNFTGTEYLFGGTTIERKNGDMIHIKFTVNDSDGEINIIMKLKKEAKVLAEEDGVYEFDFNIQDGNNYVIVKAKNYSGKLEMEVV